jgi:acyl-CoA ligase (AMP-forming) (exosortase A-associated)
LPSAVASLSHLPLRSAERDSSRVAVISHGRAWRYGELAGEIERVAAGFAGLGLARGERVAVFLDKRVEFVVAVFAAAHAGLVAVPVNPLLRPGQLQHVLADCAAAALVTTPGRAAALTAEAAAPSLRHAVLVCEGAAPAPWPGVAVHAFDALAGPRVSHRAVDSDVAAIFYTSGSTGGPKGVVLSHRNLLAGAESVAAYLDNHADDRLLAVLPLSFDAGFSQLTTAFHAGASVALLNHLLPGDVLAALQQQRITGLTAVPPLYMQLAQLDWPAGLDEHLRYFANTGGRMPRATLQRLRALLPRSRPFLMYGLTEAFRSTFLPPEEVDRRPDSIGRAIPNAEVLVLRDDGTRCAPGEVGELVHRGPLVALGYWGDAERTAERFRPLPAALRPAGAVLPEIAVFSGDLVRADDEGFLYFEGRRDEMIKTSGYRVSPSEVEEVVHASGAVAECAAFGVPHEQLGQAIVVAAVPPAGVATLDVAAVLAACRAGLPAYMVPARVVAHAAPLPRNGNGKIDRRRLAEAAGSA